MSQCILTHLHIYVHSWINACVLHLSVRTSIRRQIDRSGKNERKSYFVRMDVIYFSMHSFFRATNLVRLASNWSFMIPSSQQSFPMPSKQALALEKTSKSSSAKPFFHPWKKEVINGSQGGRIWYLHNNQACNNIYIWRSIIKHKFQLKKSEKLLYFSIIQLLLYTKMQSFNYLNIPKF